MSIKESTSRAKIPGIKISICGTLQNFKPQATPAMVIASAAAFI
jgi:hypothetical protein